MATVFTIGHSTRSIDEFIALLQEHAIEIVVDVRTVPRSRTNPQFNADALPAALQHFSIDYVHMAALGGLRGRQKSVSPSTNGFWENDSFHNYADYALTPPFQAALAELRDLAARRRCAVMCAEAVWWRCHRRIIADYLVAAGDEVIHILGPGKADPAALTAAAQKTAQGLVVYPAQAESIRP
ncbi:MAG TPA: DUF488 domain-containing protein [Pseudolabrys sp.]|nr:DUF488 domain-containing protein [Pseudolabrys sp.]